MAAAVWTPLVRTARRARLVATPNTRDEFEEQGFPSLLVDAFNATAKELDAAVMSRVPGPASTQLIHEGHALKSFYVHGKSCNWGPMAGFVCQMPAFNKRGSSKARYNLDEHVSSQAKFTKIREDEGPALVNDLRAKRHEAGKSAPTKQEQQAAVDRALAPTPWLPLTISDAALDRLFESPLNALDRHLVMGYNPGGRSKKQILGIASNANNDIVVEFVLTKAKTTGKATAEATSAGGTSRWQVYHRRAWMKLEDEPFKPYFSVTGGQLQLEQADGEEAAVGDLVPRDGRVDLPIDGSDQFEHLVTEWEKTVPSAQLRRYDMAGFFPVRVAQNPYIPYEADDPRNAITGDYDLFALWQRRGPRESVIRLSEHNANLRERARAAANSPVFRPAERWRPFTVYLAAQPGVYIDVIPNYDEIKRYEHTVLGNINDAVFLAVGMLNSVTMVQYEGEARRNVAFHSDEGGRPGIDEIEYPIAVFLPASMRTASSQGVGILLQSHSDFMSLLESLAGTCEIGMNHGWLMHLLTDLAPKAKLEAARDRAGGNKDTKDYFKDRIKYQEKQDPDDLQQLRARVANFLTGANHSTQSASTAAVSDTALDSAAFVQTVDTFIEVAFQFRLHGDKPASELADLIVTSTRSV